MSTKRSRRGYGSCAVILLVVSGPAVTCPGQPVEAPPPRIVLKGHRGPVEGLVPSSDGRLLVSTGAKDGTVRIWDLASGAHRRLIQQELVGTTMKIWDVVSPSERRLIREEPVDPADPGRGSTPSGKDRADRPVPLNGEPLHVEAALLPDNRHLFLSIQDIGQSSVCPDDLIVYDLESGVRETIFSSGAGRPRPIYLVQTASGPSGHVLAYRDMGWRSEDGAYRPISEIKLFGIPERRVLAKIGADGLDFRSFALSRGGEMIATVGSSNVFTRRKNLSGEVIVWDARTGKKLGRVRTDGRKVWLPEFSPDGRELAIGGGAAGGVILICYLGTYKITHTLNGVRDKTGQARSSINVNRLSYTPDGKYLAAPAGNGTIVLWETKDYRQVLWARLCPPEWVHAVFSPDGKTLVVTGESHRWGERWKTEDEEIRVWDLDRILSLIPVARGAAGAVRR